MITNEMFIHIIEYCVEHLWMYEADARELLRHTVLPMTIYELEELIDNDLQIMSIDEAITIIKIEFNL